MSTINDSCCMSLFDFIPETEQAAIVARTSTTDTTAYFQAAIDRADSEGGGCICVPAGTYRVNGTIQLKKKVTLEGAGQRGSILQHTGTGNCLESIWPINSSTAVDIRVRSLGIVNTQGGLNTGAGIYEQGGTYVAFEDLLIENFKYGIVLNQSELVDIDLCTIQMQSLASIWLVNGWDIVEAAAYSFTNRISVTRCQLNVASDGVGEGYCILDDGGVCHAFRDNNYNGSWIHIRAAGVLNLLVSGGEFEGAQDVSIYLTNNRRSLDGPNGNGGVGSCGAVVIENCALIPVIGHSSIRIDNCIHLTLLGNGFGNTNNAAVASIAGIGNVYQLTESGTATESAGPLFDSAGLATTRLFSTTAGVFGTATYDPPSLATGASGAIQTLTVSGARLGDPVEDVSFSADQAGVVFHAWVSAADTVSYFAQNLAGANPTNLPSGTLRVKVRRRVF
jgi:hypothetical protein